MIEYYLLAGSLSFLVAFILIKSLIPRLTKAGIIGNDVNKEGRPPVAEMGGIGIVGGFSMGVLAAIFLSSFLSFEFNLITVLAALLTIHIIAMIGVSDDLLDMPQWLKAILPLFAAIPLVAVKAAGSTEVFLPFLGPIDFGIFYIIILIPIGIAVASNLTNMLAGFNGMEAGMGAVIFGCMLLVAIGRGSVEMAVLFVSMLGALLAFLFFNLTPAKVFPGDVGNLTIGAVLASGVIIGNLESAGAILVVPYVIDFFIKVYNRFPSSKWWGDIRDGKLYAIDDKARGFAQLIMKTTKGISEKNLVYVFIAIEAVFAIFVMLLYL